MYTKITRRSIVGFGYNTNASQVWNKSQTQSFLEVDEATAPYHTGTILSVIKFIDSDRTYQSLLRGGTYYTTAWFVKLDGKWRKIKNTDENKYELDALTTLNDFSERDRTGRTYWRDEVTVEIE